ncbi:MAG TPA: hypothetical protein PKE45_05280 [Caldilineaceae bacterium]|nr:hypothetical protein [Caldilineaceae bacterium]
MDLHNPPVTSFRRELVRRDLLTPALLLLTSHRPLAFVVSQLLYLLEPLAALAGQQRLQPWAELLSDPDRLAEFERLLAEEGVTSTEHSAYDGRS